MRSMSKVCALMLPVITAWGCESIALMPRPDIDPRDVDRAGIERGSEARDRAASRDEIVGTVQRVDGNRREIHLRTTEGRMAVVKYEPATLVYSRDREVRVDSLRAGDLVLVQLNRNARGEQYADVIRVDDRQTKRAY